MDKENYGYHRKILHVDLTNKKMEVEEPDEIFYRRYIGGGIMGVYYLLKNTKPGIDPFSSDNLLMFMSSVIAGHEAPGLAQYVVSGKSPLTNGIGEARSEGPFGVALKKSGYDGIVITGKSENPVMLVIKDGHVSIEDASNLWGLNVAETTDAIEETYPKASVATIGIAGEKLVRFANVVSNRTHQASRNGMGALMGSKNLKAVVIEGGALPEVANPDEFDKLYDWFKKEMKSNTLSMWQYEKPGFGVWIHTHGLDAALAAKNYQTATFPEVDNYAPENFLPYYKGVAKSPGCPNDIIKLFATKEEDKLSGGLHQEASGALGPNLGVTDIKTVIDANVLCNQYGMDPNSLGYTISFAQECVQRGLLDPKDLNLSFSDEADILELITMIGEREGELGNLLAEGSARAAEKIGKGASKYALTVKNNEIVPFEPRSQTNLAMGYAVGPTGPRYDICEHDWDYDINFGWEHSMDNSRTVGILERIPMEYLGRDKVKNYKALNNLWSAADGLVLSIFHSAPTRVYDLDDMADLLHIITGWKTSSYEVMRIGELRNHLYRYYNCREGFTPDDDVLPERFFEEEIDYGPQKGTKLDYEKFKDAIQFYYEMMGWDESGKPLQSTLYDYGVDWLE